jgi:sulfotransferase
MMEKKYYFLSGLPRSGSTLLSSILNQNPKIYSGPGSPVVDLMFGAETFLRKCEQLRAYPNDNFIQTHISSIIKDFYKDIEKEVIIDKSRAWPNNINLIQKYITDDVKIICTVRDIKEILTSFIKINKEGLSFIDQNLITEKKDLTTENRCDHLMSDDGVVSNSLGSIYKCFERKEEKNLLFVEYNDLIENSEKTFEKIYNFLNMDYFNHNFENILQKFNINDDVYGLKNMHDVYKKIKKSTTANEVENILTERVIQKCKGLEFWRNPNLLFK